MSIEAQYPTLADLAHRNRVSLDDLACGKGTEPFIDLQQACYLIAQGYPRHDNAADHFAFLATLDEFLRTFDKREAPRAKIWRKVIVPGRSTEFLDTVCETALALRLRRAGMPVRLEVPFDPKNRLLKDADLVVTSGGTNYWLDVFSIMPQKPVFNSANPFPGRSRADLVHDFAARVAAKYNSKFRQAVVQGCADAVGVMLCFLKYEESIALFLPEIFAGETLSVPPAELWTNNPKLNLVWIHTARKGSNTDILVPTRVLAWTRPSS